MLCRKCKEHIEVGEACTTEDAGNGHVHFFHLGCHVQDKVERDARELERQAEQARLVH